MTLNRRSFLSMTAIATTLAAAAACGSDDSSTSSATDGASAASGDASSTAVARDASADLVIWADEKKSDSLKDAAKKWGDSQGITVAVQTVANELQSTFVTANQAGNGPDIVVGAHDWLGNLVQNGAISPVTIAEDAKSNISKVALDAMTYDGQYYGVPYSVETLGLFVNKKLTQEAEPATIEKLVEAAKAAGTEAILSLPVGEAGDAYHMEPIYTSAGGYLFGKNSDGTLNAKDCGVGAEGSLKAAEKMAELGKEGVLKTSITGDNAISLFTDGKAPYLVSGPWAISDVEKAGMDYALVKIPGFDGMEGARPFAGVNGFYIASKGKNAAFAQTFVADVIKDTTITKAMFDINQLPPVQTDLADELKDEYPNMVTFSQLATDNADPMPSIPEMAEVWTPLGKAEANIIKGADADSTMKSAGDAIKQAIGA